MAYRKSFLALFYALFLFGLPIIAGGLESRQKSSYDFSGCTQDQQHKIDGYLDDVQELAKAAIGPSEATKAKNHYYKAWWGTYDAKAKMLLDEKINTRYEKLSRWKSNKGSFRTFLCDPKAFCCNAGVYEWVKSLGRCGICHEYEVNYLDSNGVVACQNKRGDHDIILCSPFWTWKDERIGSFGRQNRYISLELDKWRTRSAILLHELTHALFASKLHSHHFDMTQANMSRSFRPSLVSERLQNNRLWPSAHPPVHSQ